MERPVKDASPRTIYLKDYQAPDFAIDTTQLYFDLYEDYSEVTARLVISRSAENVVPQLVLDGQDLKLLSISINDCELAKDAYEIGEETLTLNFDKVIVEGFSQQNFILETKVRIEPQNNTSLEGLYKSRTMFCTQCEAEGFRKITYYLDRPDALSEFTTRIYADKSRYPVLLSNGNPVASGDLDGGRHWAEWHDPFKKPCYLFALVAGDLVAVDDEFKTQSGRDVLLRIFVEEKDRDKCDHAMRSLKNAMRWDEDVYGREYDLDIFMIVAVDDFNMGAMENKGLNIFNTSCVLANEKTTTDAGFQRVEGVVAHEYFHNWSGNRVTCRDWFQLSLKEGFTVFRDEEFSADMGSATVKRVEDVSLLRTNQFAEDASPMAHPVQPSSFIEISNFYTLTIYEKGAEVVRMIRTLLGPALFRKGSDLYFDRHDGCAVTIEDFIAAMADVSGRDFSHFMLWYQQAGTPKLKVTGDYNQTEKTYTLKVQQSCPATPESATKKPFLIPLDAALIGEQGRIAPSKVLEVSKEQETFVFHDVAERPVPSLLRGFSAPVNLDFAYSLDDLTRLMARDDDGFCRWDASQKMAIQVINNVIVSLANDPAPTVDKRYLDAFGEVLNQAITSLKITIRLWTWQ
jgi:aminopeptidase N, Escherichia coli type